MKKWIFYLGSFLLLASCTSKSEYHQMVSRQLAKKVRHDSLFFGIHLGMERQDFYQHCWELNKQGVFRQGTNNMTVEYQLNELRYPARMDFYPNFKEEKIAEMPVKFAYHGWAPWAKHLSTDSLELDVLNYLEDTYQGEKFIKVEVPQKGAIYVKVDGNRQIIVEKQESFLDVTFTDLLTRPEYQ